MKRVLLTLTVCCLTGVVGCGGKTPPTADNPEALKAADDAVKSAQQAEGATQKK